MTLASRLPAFTWDRIAPLREKAHFHPNGPVDLSMGTPVDPVADVIRGALAEGSNAAGYPATWGTERLRSAAAGWLARAHGVRVSPDDVLPVVGTKEFIAWLPVMLGLGPGDVVVHPELAYPTYDIGARLAGATAVASDLPPHVASDWPSRSSDWPRGSSDWPPRSRGGKSGNIRLLWLNSPSNPTGRVLSAAEMRAAVKWGRAHGAVVASDECYICLGWRIAHREAGLYLWATHPGHECWSAAERLAAQCGILVGPGSLYGPAGIRHVRVALTATDERIAAAAERLAALRLTELRSS